MGGRLARAGTQAEGPGEQPGPPALYGGPIVRHRLSSLAPAVAAVLALGSCGSSGDAAAPLARPQLGAQANSICKRYAAQIAAVPSPKGLSAAQLHDYFSRVHTIASAEQTALARLRPAADVSAQWRAFLSAGGRGARLLGQIAGAAQANDAARARALLKRLKPINARTSRAATVVGASICASG